MGERGENRPGQQAAEAEAKPLARLFVELDGDGRCVGRRRPEDEVDGGVEAVELAEALDRVALGIAFQDEVGVFDRAPVDWGGACEVRERQAECRDDVGEIAFVDRDIGVERQRRVA